MQGFLPICRRDMEERGWHELDFVFISGDAYVDHPSFGPAIICRLLEKHGYKVGIIPQPDWHTTKDFDRLGKPRLGYLVSAGNMDSLLNKFTAAKKVRHEDAYSPGGQAGHRPERATIVYCNRLRELYPDVPIIIGGIEASLRRMAHYDYWSNAIRRSILVDSQADLLIYGMGERAIIEIAADLQQGIEVGNIQDVQGTCYRVPNKDYAWDYLELPSFAEVRADKKRFAEAFKLEYLEQDPIRGRRLVQQNDEWCVVQNPPALPLTEEQMDEVYDLPYMRTYHPIYEKAGGVPAIKEVQFSLVSQRGCFGGCNFCAIISHEGRIIQRRSHASLLREAKILTKLKGFKGYIHDVGGPTANFRHVACAKQLTDGACRNRHCIGSETCPNLNTSHDDYLKLLREIRSVKGVKKVFVRSGLRYDYVLADHNKAFVKELCQYHVSGQLKVAPEHVVKHVTDLMGKADVHAFLKFKDWFDEANRELGKKQYLVPYFMSSHPGCTLKDAVALAEFLRDMHMQPEQVQDFIPTPGSLSTAMYYTGLNPLTGEKVYVARRPEEKQMQRALMQYKNPANYDIVYKALCLAGRRDLIGYGPKCLIAPRRHQAGRRPDKAGRHAAPPRRQGRGPAKTRKFR